MTNGVSQAVMNAISTWVNRTIDDWSNDITIKAIINKCEDATAHKYSATYNGGTITVYDSKDNRTFAPNTEVYVMVPAGDYSQKLFILDDTKTETTIDRSLDTSINNYSQIGSNVISVESFQDVSTGSISYALPLELNAKSERTEIVLYKNNESSSYSTPYLTVNQDELAVNMEYAEAFLVKANFTTKLTSNAFGEYGIIVKVNYKDATLNESATVDFVFSTTKMSGDPMLYIGGSSQSLLCPFPSALGTFESIESITAYIQGFSSIEDQGAVTISSLELYALDEISAKTDDGYQLTITTPQGNTLSGNSRKKTRLLQANFTCNSQTLDNVTYYWGKEDGSVTYLSNDYHSKIGSGYSFIESNTTGKLTVSALDCAASANQYKCTVVYNDVVLSQTTYIYNTSVTMSVDIVSNQGTEFYFSNGSPILTCRVNGNKKNFNPNYTDASFSFSWMRTNGSSDGIVNLDNDNYEIDGNQLTIKQLSAQDTTAVYSCTVKCQDKTVGIASITLTNDTSHPNQNAIISISNGNQVFQYDEYGISPASQKMADPITPLDLEIKFSEDDKNATYYWILPDSQSTLITIPTENITTTDSGEVHYSGQIFPLTIAESYNAAAYDNQLTAVVESNGQRYTAQTSLLFLKVGDNGTNGTSTVARITEAITPKNDEDLLALVQLADDTVMWNGLDSTNQYISSGVSGYDTNLYTNSDIVEGYTTNWSLLGATSGIGATYTVNQNAAEDVLIDLNNNSSQLDYRTLRAELTLDNKRYYATKNVPMIKYYQDGYNLNSSYIGIVRDSTLQDIIYDSSGNNPSYNSNIGIKLRLPLALKNAVINWAVESGPYDNGYYNPNFTISNGQYVTTGTTKLTSMVSGATTLVQFTATIKSLIETSSINEVLTAQKQIFDTILSSNKSENDRLNELSKALEAMTTNANWVYNDYQTMYNLYQAQYNTNIISELEDINTANSLITGLNTKIRAIWDKEWPNYGSTVITGYQEYIGLDIVGTKQYESLTPCKLWNAFVQKKDNIYNFTISSRDAIDTTSLSNLYTAFGNIYTQMWSYCYDYLYSFKTDYEKAFKKDSDYYNLCKAQYNAYYKLYENREIKTINASSIIEAKEQYEDWFTEEKNAILKAAQDQMNTASEWIKQYNDILESNANEIFNTIYVIPNQSFNGVYSNNNVSATITLNSVQIAKVWIPITLRRNVNELASLNGWDGTSIEINEDEGYMLSPQIGAGVKDSQTNTFTGIVMGALSNIQSDGYSKEEKVGLLGYKDGIQSLFLDAKTGSATFGYAAEDGSDDDACIQLIPGGISSIAGWKMGKNLFYNIPGSTYEHRADVDARVANANKAMIPQYESGILLSADDPYIHIKGKPFETSEILSKNTGDEYEMLNPDDSFELRLDPDNKSLFSIIHHTDGIGDGETQNLFYGKYKTDSLIKKISSIQLNILEDDDDNYTYTAYVYDTDEPYYTAAGWKIECETDNLAQELYDIFNENDADLIQEKTSFTQNEIRIHDLANLKYSIANPTGIVISSDSYYSYPLSLNSSQMTETFNNVSIAMAGENIDHRNDDSTKILIATATPNDGNVDNFSLKINSVDFNTALEGLSFEDTSAIAYYFTLENNSSEIISQTEEYALKDLTNETYSFSFKDEYSIYEDGIQYKLYLVFDFKDECSYNQTFPIQGNFERYNGYLPIEIKNYPSQKYGDDTTSFGGAGKDYGLGSKDNQYVYFGSTAVDGNFFSFNNTADNDYLGILVNRYQSNYFIVEIPAKGSYEIKYDTGLNNYSMRGWYFYTYKKTNALYAKINLENALNDFIKCNKTISGKGYIAAQPLSNSTDDTPMIEDSNFSGVIQYNLETNGNISISSNTVKYFFVFKNSKDEIVAYSQYDESAGEYRTTIFEAGVWADEEYTLYAKEEFSDDLSVCPTKITFGEKTIYNIIKNPRVVDKASYLDYEITEPKNFSELTPRDMSKLYIQSEDGYGYQGTEYSSTNSNDVTIFKEYYEVSPDQYIYIDYITDTHGRSMKLLRTISSASVKNNIGMSDSYTYNTLDSDFDSIAANWKEYVKVGLDENGRFFTNGPTIDKVTSRTGQVYGFDGLPGLFGQEMKQITTSNDVNALLKIFSPSADSIYTDDEEETTYITAGKDETNKIILGTKDTVSLGIFDNSKNLNKIPSLVSSIVIDKDNLNFNSTSNNSEFTNYTLAFGNSIKIKDTDENISLTFSSKDKKIEISKVKTISASATEWTTIAPNIQLKAFDNNNSSNTYIQLNCSNNSAGEIILNAENINLNGNLQSTYLKLDNDSSKLLSSDINSYLQIKTDNTILQHSTKVRVCAAGSTGIETGFNNETIYGSNKSYTRIGTDFFHVTTTDIYIGVGTSNKPKYKFNIDKLLSAGIITEL